MLCSHSDQTCRLWPGQRPAGRLPRLDWLLASCAGWPQARSVLLDSFAAESAFFVCCICKHTVNPQLQANGLYFGCLFVCGGVYLPAQYQHHSDSDACVARTWKFTRAYKHTLTSFCRMDVSSPRKQCFGSQTAQIFNLAHKTDLHLYICCISASVFSVSDTILQRHLQVACANYSLSATSCGCEHFFKTFSKASFAFGPVYMSQNFGTILAVCPHLNAWKRSYNGAPEWSIAKAPPLWANLKRGHFQWFPIKSLVFENVQLWRFYACLTHYRLLPTGTCTTACVWTAWRWASIWCLHWKLFCHEFWKGCHENGAKTNHNGSRGNSHTPTRCGHKSQSENISPYLQAQNWSWFLAVEIKKDGSGRENQVSLKWICSFLPCGLMLLCSHEK